MSDPRSELEIIEDLEREVQGLKFNLKYYETKYLNELVYALFGVNDLDLTTDIEEEIQEMRLQYDAGVNITNILKKEML